MAYVHFRIMNGRLRETFDCRINGLLTTFESGEYMKVRNGMLVISFDGGITQWNVQAMLSEYDCIDIQLMVGYQDAHVYKTVIGQPIYKVSHFEKNEVGFMEDAIEELRIERENKEKLKKFYIAKCGILVCGTSAFGVGMTGLINPEAIDAAGVVSIPLIATGAALLVVGILFNKKFIFRKK